MKTFDFHREYLPLAFVDIDPLLKDDTMVTGGHFTFQDGKPVLNDGTLVSFSYSLRAYTLSRSRGIRTKLGILINDIGQVCSEEQCSIRTPSFDRKDFRFPEEYLRLLDEYGIPENDIFIFWEKFIRNRGKKELKRAMRKSTAIRQDEGGYWLDDEDRYGKLVLTRSTPKDPYGTPACPLIMAALLKEQERMGCTSSVNFYYVGNDNFQNIPNHFVIEKGSRVGAMFDCPLSAHNIFFTKHAL